MAILWIDGVEMPAPSELKVEIFDVGSNEERSADGGLVIDRIATKRSLTLKWPHLEPAQLGDILGRVGQPFFDVTYPDPETASLRTMQCTCTDRAAGILMIRSGAPLWTDIRLTLLEAN